MINAGIIGATGYAGAQLVYLLSNHNEVTIKYLSSKSYENYKFSDIYPNIKGSCDLVLEKEDIEKASTFCDVIFLALPPGVSTTLITESILKNTLIIDLGADFRLDDADTYELWYKKPAPNQKLLDKSIYGLCEITKEKIKHTKLIANPGCYTTCSILTLAPLIDSNLISLDSIIINAMSGVSGAGRSAKVNNLFCECNSSVKAYGISTHRHTPEIEMALSQINGEKLSVQFTPHLIPMNRGILSTCCAKLKADISQKQLTEIYEEFYKDQPFVKLRETPCETRFVLGTNRIDIHCVIDKRTNNIIATGAIDNLIKGAAGQAVQNMNIYFNIDQTLGLPIYSANPY